MDIDETTGTSDLSGEALFWGRAGSSGLIGGIFGLEEGGREGVFEGLFWGVFR